jgi:probable rRNA maturation factor
MRKTSLHVHDPSLRIDPESFHRCLALLDAFPAHRPPPGSVALACVDRAGSGSLHQQFFGDPDPTDVMTFPGDPDDGHAGDIAICAAIAEEAARERNLPFAEELTLYLVHGWLHLGGLDDRTARDRQVMREAEAAVMALLREKGGLLEADRRPPPPNGP